MRPFWRGLRRFWIVTLGGGVTALNLLGAMGVDARAGTGIGSSARPGCTISRPAMPKAQHCRVSRPNYNLGNSLDTCQLFDRQKISGDFSGGRTVYEEQHARGTERLRCRSHYQGKSIQRSFLRSRRTCRRWWVSGYGRARESLKGGCLRTHTYQGEHMHTLLGH